MRGARRFFADLLTGVATLILTLALGAAGTYLYPWLAGLFLALTLLLMALKIFVAPFLPGLRRLYTEAGTSLAALALSCISLQVLFLMLLAPWFAAANAVNHHYDWNVLQVPLYEWVIGSPLSARWIPAFHVLAGICGLVMSLIYLAVDLRWRLQQIHQVGILPRSKASSAAIGLAEFTGIARVPGTAGAASGHVIIDPLQKTGSKQKFLLEDETGSILVDPGNAVARSGWASHVGGIVNEIILRPSAGPDGKQRHSLKSGDLIYVLGNVQINPDAASDAMDSAALVVRPLETPRWAGPFWKLIFGNEPAGLAISPENVFVLTNVPEGEARVLLRGRIFQIVTLTIAWVAASAWLVTMELPRVLDDRHWSLSVRGYHALPRADTQTLVNHLTDPDLRMRARALEILWSRRNALQQPPSTLKEQIPDGREASSTTAKMVPGLLRAFDVADAGVRRFAAHALGTMTIYAGVIVPRMIERTRAPDPGLRVAAIGVLGRLAREPATVVPALMAKLDDADASVATAACHALVPFDEAASSAFACLKPLLGAKEEDSRRKAMQSILRIRNIPDEDMLGLLRPMLNGPDPMLRYYAAIGLNRIGAKAIPALPELLEALKTPNHSGRVFVVRALAKIGPPAVGTVPLLIALLNNSRGEHSLRQDAVQTLRRIGAGAAAAIPLLEEIEKTDNNITTRGYASQALRAIGAQRR